MELNLNAMKKTIGITLGIAMLICSSCDRIVTTPQHVQSTSDRQGLTSLTAIFTSGPYADQELARLTITDDSQERYVIPVPYYFPESSDNTTLGYMTRVRVRAELQPNYRLSPPLTILDLTEENEFTYTDPRGNARRIVITGERVRSSACEITSFAITSPFSVTGVIDKENRVITLPTKEDVSACKASVQLSPHASISPDPTREHDYTDGFNYTVTADDGTTARYLVQTGDPERIEQGINSDSKEQLFNLDPVTRIGLPPYTVKCYPSLAYNNGRLVYSDGVGGDLVVINALTGDRTGVMNRGEAEVGVIANDEGGHIIMANYAPGGSDPGTVNIFSTADANAAPQLFHSFVNPADCPIGHKMKVLGDIASEAVIVFTVEGISGVTTCGKAVVLKVEEGAVTETDIFDFYEHNGLGWGEAPVNVATVVAVSMNYRSDGFLLDYYEGGVQELNTLHWINGSYVDVPITGYGGGSSWGLNANCLDTKHFNNSQFFALLVVSHFPMWGLGPMLHLYGISDPSSPSLIFESHERWYQSGASGVAAGDVILAPSADGYYLNIFYIDHNSQAIGGYRFDCIKK